MDLNCIYCCLLFYYKTLLYTATLYVMFGYYIFCNINVDFKLNSMCSKSKSILAGKNMQQEYFISAEYISGNNKRHTIETTTQILCCHLWS